MKRNLRLVCFVLCICILSASVTLSVGAPETTQSEQRMGKYITLYGTELRCSADGFSFLMRDKAYTRDGKAYVSADDVLPALEYIISWDVERSAFVCEKESVVSYVFPTRKNIWVGSQEYVFDHRPLIISGRLYISEDMLYVITGYDVAVEGVLDEYQLVTFADNGRACSVDGVPVDISTPAFSMNGQAYLPIEEVLPAIGYWVSWDSEQQAFVCTKDGLVSYLYPSRNNIWVGTEEYVFDHTPVSFRGKTYVSEKMFKALTGSRIQVSGGIEEYMNVTLIGGQKYCRINGQDVPMRNEAYICYGKPHLPLEDVLPAMGYSYGWDAEISAVSCTKNGITSYIFPFLNNMWVGTEEYVFDTLPLIIGDRTYVSADVLETLACCGVVVEGTLSNRKDGMSIMDSVRTDQHRLPKTNVYSGNGVTVVNGFAMELVSLSTASAENYASVINTVAASLDSNIKVYNMLVPTSAEYYAPASMYPNQLPGIQKAYSCLSDRVIPVNVYDILAEKAGEKLYFKTDHHWTQRGAYYAYKEFMAYQNIEVPDLSTFENVTSNSFVGSFASFARGTYAGTIIKNSPELLERFVPKTAKTGKVYSNPSLSYSSHSVEAVSTRTNSYSAFIGGDNPITVFETSANSDKVLVIIKESFGNAFATWAMNDYKKVCVIDPRRFNGFDGNNTAFNLNQFCRTVGATDVLFINYPIVAGSAPIKNAILKMK